MDPSPVLLRLCHSLSDQTASSLSCMLLSSRVMTEISPRQGKNITKTTISDTQKPPAMESILWLFLTQESDWKWEMSFQQLLLCEKLLQLNFSRSTSALGFRARWSRGNLKFLSEVKTLELFSNCSAAVQLLVESQSRVSRDWRATNGLREIHQNTREPETYQSVDWCGGELSSLAAVWWRENISTVYIYQRSVNIGGQH